MLTDLLNRPCLIVNRAPDGGRSRYGAETTSETVTSTVCELQQRQRDEDTVAGDVSRTSWLLVLPAGTEVRQDSQVVVDGDTFEVDGEPWEARNPRTKAVSHVEVSVVRTTGPDDDRGGS
jgi:hypothetical protein